MKLGFIFLIFSNELNIQKIACKKTQCSTFKIATCITFLKLPKFRIFKQKLKKKLWEFWSFNVI